MPFYPSAPIGNVNTAPISMTFTQAIAGDNNADNVLVDGVDAAGTLYATDGLSAVVTYSAGQVGSAAQSPFSIIIGDATGLNADVALAIH